MLATSLDGPATGIYVWAACVCVCASTRGGRADGGHYGPRPRIQSFFVGSACIGFFVIHGPRQGKGKERSEGRIGGGPLRGPLLGWGDLLTGRGIRRGGGPLSVSHRGRRTDLMGETGGDAKKERKQGNHWTIGPFYLSYHDASHVYTSIQLSTIPACFTDRTQSTARFFLQLCVPRPTVNGRNRNALMPASSIAIATTMLRCNDAVD